MPPPMHHHEQHQNQLQEGQGCSPTLPPLLPQAPFRDQVTTVQRNREEFDLYVTYDLKT